MDNQYVDWIKNTDLQNKIINDIEDVLFEFKDTNKIDITFDGYRFYYRRINENCKKKVCKMIATTEKIEYGKEIIEFELLQENRKTLSIEVLPTTKIKVKAPESKNKQDIIKKVQNKAKWITKQKRYFVDNYKKPVEKKYVSGECFRYLGKQYRLKVIKSNADSVKLKNGYLAVEYCLKTPTKLIEKWYMDKALSTYEKELDKCFQQFTTYGLTKPNLKIHKFTKRWGSYNKNSNTITMNIETIKANKDCIDYVIYHELCHCMYFAHNKEFYTLLESKCKDWSKLKNKLEMLTL